MPPAALQPDLEWYFTAKKLESPSSSHGHERLAWLAYAALFSSSLLWAGCGRETRGCEPMSCGDALDAGRDAGEPDANDGDSGVDVDSGAPDASSLIDAGDPDGGRDAGRDAPQPDASVPLDGGVDGGRACRALAFWRFVSPALIEPVEGVAIADLDHVGPAELLLAVETPDASFVRSTHLVDGGLVVTGGRVTSFSVSDAVISQRPLASDTRSLVVADQDHDSWSDVMTESVSGISMLHNVAGGGRRLVPWTLGLGSARRVALAAYSGVGPDLARLDVGSSASSLLLFINDGTGAFQNVCQAYFTGVGERLVGGARNDRDGGYFVTATESGVVCHALDGAASCPRRSTRSLGTTPHALSIGALAADGGTAVVVALDGGFPTGGDELVSIDVGAGDVTSSPLVSLGAVPATAHAIAISDLDGDGIPEVVVATDVGVTILVGGPAPGTPSALELPSPVPALELAIGDLDGDGRPEIVAISHQVVVVWSSACAP